jgi:hypothetical protein
MRVDTHQEASRLKLIVKVGLRQHWGAAAVDVECDRVHATRGGALKIRLNRAVAVGDDVPTRLCPPRGATDLLIEQIGHPGEPASPRRSSVRVLVDRGERIRANRPHPDSPICQLNIRGTL